MKPFTPEADEAFRAALESARASLDRIITEAHSFALLGVAVDCFLAQANLDSAIRRLNIKRLEALARERIAVRSGAAVAGPRQTGPVPLRAWEFRKTDGSTGVCAWCQSELHIAPEPGQSHGICPSHQVFVRSQLGAVKGQGNGSGNPN